MVYRSIVALLALMLAAVPASPAPAGVELVPGGVDPVRGFTTDFSRATVSGDRIRAGGPPKDGIPAIDNPVFVAVSEIDWIGEDEPVLVVSADGVTHIYPLQILTFHEIVNDVVGNTPLAVTFCPLCNTGIVFEREFDGRVLDFGTTGRLRYSNLLMHERQTETWWQQATGEAVVGEYAGRQLAFHPVMMIPWDVASAARTRFARSTAVPGSPFGRREMRSWMNRPVRPGTRPGVRSTASSRARGSNRSSGSSTSGSATARSRPTARGGARSSVFTVPRAVGTFEARPPKQETHEMILPLNLLEEYQGNVYELTVAAIRRAYQITMTGDEELDENDGKVVSTAVKQILTQKVQYRIED
jgi:DNA-directed RNA polymerase subunit K/omega